MHDTFETFALSVLDKIILLADNQHDRFDFVCDTYRKPSIKDEERERRNKVNGIRVKILSPKQKCPKQWQKYLANGETNMNFRISFSKNGYLYLVN